MDTTFVSIGESLTVKEAVNKALPFLLDANQALFEIDSDSEPRLIHLVCSRGAADNTPWTVRLENDKLTEIQKYFTAPNEEGHDAEKYNPPRVVDSFGQLVPEPGTSIGDAGFFPSLIKNLTRPGNYGEYTFYTKLYDFYPLIPGGAQVSFLKMDGEQRYRHHIIQEVGTYIVPICYHRTTDKGFESIQVLRSDAQFWPMPPHAAYSIDEVLTRMYRDPPLMGTSIPGPQYVDP